MYRCKAWCYIYICIGVKHGVIYICIGVKHGVIYICIGVKHGVIYICIGVKPRGGGHFSTFSECFEYLLSNKGLFGAGGGGAPVSILDKTVLF